MIFIHLARTAWVNAPGRSATLWHRRCSIGRGQSFARSGERFHSSEAGGPDLRVLFCSVKRFARLGMVVAGLLFSSVTATGISCGPFLAPALAAERQRISWERPVPVCCPLDLRHLVVHQGASGSSGGVPRSLKDIGVRSVVFQFLGNEKVFIGIVVRAFGPGGKVLRHGLFDQGPIDEVLTRVFFGRVLRVRTLGVFERQGKRYLVVGRSKTGKEAWIPLESALSVLLTHVGRQPDLLWGAS